MTFTVDVDDDVIVGHLTDKGWTCTPPTASTTPEGLPLCVGDQLTYQTVFCRVSDYGDKYATLDCELDKWMGNQISARIEALIGLKRLDGTLISHPNPEQDQT